MKAIIDCWNRHGCIHCAAAGFQAEIQIHGVIHGVTFRRIGGNHFLEDIEIDFDAMCFLACCSSEVRQGRVRFPVFRRGLREPLTSYGPNMQTLQNCSV